WAYERKLARKGSDMITFFWKDVLIYISKKYKMGLKNHPISISILHQLLFSIYGIKLA
ncbi:MAG: hypothetical protein ACI8UX_002293, partial [Psychromonas sp.]